MSTLKFHAVVIQDAHEPFLISYDTVELLSQQIRKFRGTDTYVFPYHGNPMHITKGPEHRFLIDDEGFKHQLFNDDDSSLEIDSTGRMSVK